ncbi:MAG: imidazolonepropionase [Actinomycetota bacterium]|nr:imidazolonepropionase [Actinomycetota bacterium]
MNVSFHGAQEILRPPRDRLAFLRGADVAGQSLIGGGLSVKAGTIAALDPDPGADLQVDARGCALVPGFVDCHTHLPFAGWREDEYQRKLRGEGYEAITRDGGGIAASARALADSDDAAVLGQAAALAAEMLRAGTTTFECKSGYGLSRDGELRTLRLARELEARVAQTSVSTALLAHAVPPGFSAQSWLEVVQQMMPEVLSLGTVSALDIFVDAVAFSNAELETMGAVAAAAGLALRCHVEQFGGYRSVPVALAVGARSVDHLSTLHPDDVAPLAAADCAAVLLPAAEFLGAERRAPGRDLLDAGALVVLATDLNPGTAPVTSMPLVIGLGARLYGMSALETLAAVTLNAAWVLGLESTLGSIEPGKRADLLLLDCPVAQIAYRLGRDPVLATFVGGEPVYVRDAWAAARISGR